VTRRGFTLLEVLVALVAAATVALLVHRGTAEVGALAARAAERRAAAAEAAAVRRQFAGWLRGTYVDPTRPDRRFEGTDGGEETQGGDRLRFRTSTASWGRTGSLQVALAVEPGAGLVADVVDETEPGAAAAARRVPLVPGATGLEMRYFLDIPGDRRWVRAWSTSVRLPRAVEVRVLGDSVPPLLRAPLVVALPGGT
jgi:prepilin-type N-terminal cleavage/methylation domain-containing protein